MKTRLFKIHVFVPASHVESLKQKMFESGAGNYEKYDSCCWQVLGEGQFRPLKGSDPFLGKTDEITKVPEYKVEMICREASLNAAISALKQNHPYEEPAYEVYEIFQ
jgi:hypothetical protein